MSKEIIEKNGTANEKHESSWNVPWKITTTLNAKTAEEEYLATRKLEIEETQKKIAENSNLLKEVKNSLSDENEVLSEFSVKILSGILSEDEMKIVEEWRNRSELIDAVKHSDSLEELVKKIIEWIKEFSDEEKIVISQYLQRKNIIYLGMSGNDSLGFYYTDFPDEMDYADEVERNLERLGIDKFVKYVWDSCYRVDDNVKSNAKAKILRENSSEWEKQKHTKIDEIKNEWKKLQEQLEDLEERKNAVEEFGLPEKEALSLYRWSEDLDWVQRDMVNDKENHVCVILNDYTEYPGSWGSEYGTTINIKRGKNTASKKFKYRDSQSSRYDRDEYDYREIKDVKVDWDKVEVTVASHKSTDTYEFNIAYKEASKSKEKINKKEFKKEIEEVEKKLISDNTLKLKYPASYNLSLRKVPWAFGNEWMSLESELPFEEAKIVYEDLKPEEWVAHITLLKHCDATWDMWRQYWLIKYVVTPQWAENVWEFFYWEQQLKDGDYDKKTYDEFKHW